LARDHGFIGGYRVSAKTGYNIIDGFSHLIREVLKVDAFSNPVREIESRSQMDVTEYN
jgi:hypothetical protein